MAENIQPVTARATEHTKGAVQGRGAGLSRWAGIAVFSAVAVPMLAAYIVFYTGLGMPKGTINQGELLTPAKNVTDIELLSDNGDKILLADEAPKWRYLILGGEQCAAECEKLLYTTRQVHIRLGDKAHRVERMLVTADALSEQRLGELKSEHPRLRFSTVDRQQLDNWLANSDHPKLAGPNALLVDQNGFAMMVYDNRNTGNQLLKDIKRLLKYSYEK
ncbi:hypothetical protein [Microbulbifer pacificus]|uniref:Cytochrome oxidase Cu insertion factor, SCO1/SenC/PrrC family n=1 Tax=Microbulbifer pacificus TaxID=407164 RepID=A0AAU0MUS5_9GAMM|nr:hypothetical protein [Microbulbifer pacificus]WOX03930.1 hypothetical protein R5R33_09265 [Microbulbifer pacificus]